MPNGVEVREYEDVITKVIEKAQRDVHLEKYTSRQSFVLSGKTNDSHKVVAILCGCMLHTLPVTHSP